MLSKADFIAKVAEDAEVTKAVAAKVFESVFDTIAGELADGEKVAIHGFGTFTVKDRAARKGRNPQTGAEMLIPAKKVVGFKAASAVSTQVNG